jgi:transcription initiation factor IIF auxiliary subunit
VKEPPYKISVSGNGSFELMLKVYFNNNEKTTFQYGLYLFTCEVSTVLREIIIFRKPSKNFREKLILAGGQPAESLPATSQKAKPKKRPSANTPTKGKKKRRLEIDDESDSDVDASSRSERNKSIPIITSDSSSDDEWTLSQASKI